MTLTTTGFDWVREVLRRESAIVLAPGKEYLVEARLAPVARARGLADVGELVRTMRERTDEATTRAVVEALTTNETSWLRDGDPFAALVGTVLPQLYRERRPDEPVRVWSAACSSGQEPYTVAMLARQAAPATRARLRIDASDISRAMVERTRAGRYSRLEVDRGLPAPLLAEHFQRTGCDWQISQEMRAMVHAREVNLAAPLPPGPPYDVVLLRNVLIYFDVPTKRDVLARVRRRMRPDGWLFLGGAESLVGVDDAWHRQTVGRTSAYRPTTGE